MNQSLEVTVPLRESIDDPEGGLVGVVYPTLKLMATDSQLTLTQHGVQRRERPAVHHVSWRKAEDTLMSFY